MADTPTPTPYAKFAFDTEFFEVVGTHSHAAVGPTAAQRRAEEENTRQEAYNAGYNAGLAEAQKAAQGDLAQLQQNLQNTLLALQKSQNEREVQLLNQMLTFTRVSLHRIVGHAAEHYGAEMLESHLRSLLDKLKTDESLTLRIHPTARGFHEKLQLPQAAILGLPMQINPDSSLGPTDAVVEWRNGGVESRLSTHLAELDSLLLSVGAQALPMNVAPPPSPQTEGPETASTKASSAPQPLSGEPLDDAEQAAKARAAELLGDEDLVDALKS
jgi:flagellar biosynthesis/type III secretory pathway protein FliH